VNDVPKYAVEGTIMSDQKQQPSNQQQNKNNPQTTQHDNREQQEISQEKPSHMNQGNQTFRPNQEKKQVPGERRENEGTGRPQQDDHSRKAS
jgi:hypothetical protein